MCGSVRWSVKGLDRRNPQTMHVWYNIEVPTYVPTSYMYIYTGVKLGPFYFVESFQLPTLASIWPFMVHSQVPTPALSGVRLHYFQKKEHVSHNFHPIEYVAGYSFC